MPRTLGAEMREQIALEDREQLQLKRSHWNATGFVGVRKVGKKIEVPGLPSSAWRWAWRVKEAAAAFSSWPLRHGGGCCRDAGRDRTRLQELGRRQDPLATEAEQAAQATREACEAGTASTGASADANGYSHGGAPCMYDVQCTHRACDAAPDAALVVCAAHVRAYVVYM